MGLKDKVFGKMLDKMLGGVDVNKIQQNAQNGKYDLNKMVMLMQNMIGKEASDKLMSEIQSRVAKGEKVNMKTVMDMVKNIDLSKVQEKAKKGEINVNDMKNTLSEIVGEKQSEDILKKAETIAKEEEDK